MAQNSLLKGKPFFCREWAFIKSFHCVETRNTSKTCGLLITGGPGSGKTALCCEMVWPTVGDANNAIGKQHALSKRIIAYHFCQAHDVNTLSLTRFIHSLVDQLVQSNLIRGYADKLSDPEVVDALEFSACEKNPDEAFKKAILFPLLELDVPKQAYILLVDSIDESYLLQVASDKSASGSKTIAELLSNHHQLLPQWILLVLSARKQSKSVTRMFTGFRKIALDDLRKSNIVRDVQQYILSRLDREDTLRQHLSRETAEMLNQLHIKSNGCFLYLERVLDGVANSFIMLREIREIPGTLNGLYLWLCQRLFTRKQFAKIQPILNVLLATRKPVTAEDLYRSVWTRNTNLTRDEFHKRLNLLSKILIEGSGTTKILFHHSFAEWLLDVKHCTQKYLCHVSDGHAMIAMFYSMMAKELESEQVQDFALHLSKMNVSEPLEHAHLPLWLLMCGTPVEDSLQKSVPCEQKTLKLLLDAGAHLELDNKQQPSDDEDDDNRDPISALIDSGSDINEFDSNHRTLLHCAAYESNSVLVEALINKGADVEIIEKNGQTALNLASRQGDVEIVSILLKHGKANPDHADNEGWTPLRSAAWGGNTKVVEALLERGAQVDNADSDNRTALRAAAWGGHEDIVLKLLEHGASVNKVDNEGRTALIAAAYMGHTEIVEHLLNHDAEINHEDADGRTALSVAALCVPASEGHSAVVSLLLERGAEVDHKDRDGMTPLLVSAFEGHREVCELLLESDGDVDHIDNNNRTSLLAAASMGHSDVVSLLLFWGAAIDAIDGEGRTVLSVAAAQGNADVVRQLLDRGLDEMHRDNAGWTPLHYGSFEGHREVCDLLVEAGARVFEVDNEGKIPLILAAQEGHTPVVKTLIEHASSVDHRSHDGKTSLRVAALEGHKDTVHLLLSSAADINYIDADGRSTLYLVALDCNEAMTAFLLENGADVDLRDLEGRTPLHVTSWQGHIKIVELLLIHGADVNAIDNDRRTALQSAAWQGHTDIVRLLLQQGAIADHTCNQGATALSIAAQEGHEDVVRVLLEYEANPDHTDQFNRTAMKVALKNGHDNVVKLLDDFLSLQGGSQKYDGADKECAGSNSMTSVTSLSTAETKVCSAVLGSSAFGPTTSSSLNESPERSAEADKRQSYVSNQSSSKSSSNLTTSTNKSASRPEVLPIGTHNSGASIGSGHGNKNSDSMSFTQQLQQCSLNKNRPLSRLLSPLSEPQSPPQSPLSDHQESLPPTPPPRSFSTRNPMVPAVLRDERDEVLRSSVENRHKRNGIVTNPNFMSVNSSSIVPSSCGARSKQQLMVGNYDTPPKLPSNFNKKETPL